MRQNKPVLAVVIPCYNEEEMIEKTNEVLQEKLSKMLKNNLIDQKSFLCFIDDGSRDKTFEILKKKKENTEGVEIKILKLSRNFGHQNALLAGYHFVTDQCDCVISIDCDLQDDIDIFEQFLKKYTDGYDVVFGVRKSREKDTFFKRTTANLFYKIMQFMCNDGRGGGMGLFRTMLTIGF